MSSVDYFAYGSNMAGVQLVGRVGQVAGHGSVARLDGYRFVINGRGVATVVPEAAGSVYGILWRLSGQQIEAMDRYEGVHRALYQRFGLGVAAPAGPIAAQIYLAADVSHGVPRRGYLEGIIAAARAWQLPSEYVEELCTWIGR